LGKRNFSFMWERLWTRLHSAQPYLVALAIYAGSRIVVLAGLDFGEHYVPLDTHPGIWSIGTAPLRGLLRWDGGWYLSVATHGYSYDGNPSIQQNVNFYPLYPLVSRIVATALHIEIYNALLLVANLASVTAILLLTKLVCDEFGDEVSSLTIALVSFFSGSLFLSAAYTEGLALLLFVAFFVLLRRERWLWAATCVSLAMVTRATGFVLLPVLLWAIWRRHGKDAARLLRYGPLAAMIAVAAPGAFMIYLWHAFGDPLAFVHADLAWQNGWTLGARVHDGLTFGPLRDATYHGISRAANDSRFFILCLAGLILGIRRLPSTMTLLTLGVVLLNYLTVGLGSFTRHGFLAFPVFIVAAEVCRGRPWLTFPAIGVSAIMLFIDTALFSRWYAVN
jgi:hypothetical protein